MSSFRRGVTRADRALHQCLSKSPQVLLRHRLKNLRLATLKSVYAELARQCVAEGKDHAHYLPRLDVASEQDWEALAEAWPPMRRGG